MIFKQEFDARVEEIGKYFTFLENIENENRILTNYQRDSSISIDDDLLKVLKANGFLLLYNLVEATIVNCVGAIFDEIKINNLSYSTVNENIKKYWSKHVYKFDEKISKERLLREKFYNIVEIIISNVAIEISDRLEYGGSIDARIMKKLATELGIQLTMDHYREDTHGKALESIKKNRNDLAHGKKSFSDIAKDITYNGAHSVDDEGRVKIQSFGLIHFKDLTIEHLSKFIESIELYIENGHYKLAVD